MMPVVVMVGERHFQDLRPGSVLVNIPGTKGRALEATQHKPKARALLLIGVQSTCGGSTCLSQEDAFMNFNEARACHLRGHLLWESFRDTFI